MIPRIEYIFLKKIIEKKNIIFVTSLFIIALLLRISGRNFLSGDMQRFLIPWFIEIKGSRRLWIVVSNSNIINDIYRYKSSVFIQTVISNL